MQDLIGDELRKVLAAWDAGNSIRSIPLGHSTVVDGLDQSGMPREVRQVFRQRKAHAYAFQLIAAGLRLRPPFLHSDFWQIVLDVGTRATTELSVQECDAAESLAWKALLRGWKIATAGFPESSYILISRDVAPPQVKPALPAGSRKIA
jgi:hypothetical protein